MDHASWGVEGSAFLAGFLAGELADEVLVDRAEDVVGAVVATLAEANCADQVHQFAQALLVQALAPVVAGQHASQAWVFSFDELHGGVDELTYLGLLCH